MAVRPVAYKDFVSGIIELLEQVMDIIVKLANGFADNIMYFIFCVIINILDVMLLKWVVTTVGARLAGRIKEVSVYIYSNLN